MSAEDNLNIVQRHSTYALWGGTFLGAIAGIIIGGPQFREWESPMVTWGFLIACCSLIGAVVGFIFFKLLGPGIGQSTYGSGSDGYCGGGDGGGDGGGGD